MGGSSVRPQDLKCNRPQPLENNRRARLNAKTSSPIKSPELKKKIYNEAYRVVKEFPLDLCYRRSSILINRLQLLGIEAWIRKYTFSNRLHFTTMTKDFEIDCFPQALNLKEPVVIKDIPNENTLKMCFDSFYTAWHLSLNPEAIRLTFNKLLDIAEGDLLSYVSRIEKRLGQYAYNDETSDIIDELKNAIHSSSPITKEEWKKTKEFLRLRLKIINEDIGMIEYLLSMEKFTSLHQKAVERSLESIEHWCQHSEFPEFDEVLERRLSTRKVGEFLGRNGRSKRVLEFARDLRFQYNECCGELKRIDKRIRKEIYGENER